MIICKSGPQDSNVILIKVKNLKVKVPIVSIALSQLCNLSVSAHLRLQWP